MAKFSKGDKVESVKKGAKGVVDEVYGDEKYAVLFDGATNPDRVEGFQIKAANGCAKNAKFKIGDKVRVDSAFSSNVNDGMGIVDAIQGDDVIVSFGGYGKVRVPSAYVYINSPASTNAVVQNAINARRARNAIDFNGASAKVRKAFEGRLEKIVQKFKNDLRAVSTDVAKEYKKYQSIEPDSATLILEVGDWIESLKGSVDDSW